MTAKVTPLTVMGVAGAPFRPPFGAFTGKPIAAINVIYVSSTTGMLVGDTIEIMLDNGEFFRTTVTSIPLAGQILLAKALPSRASAGNIVLDLTQATIVAPVNLDNI